MAPPPQPKRGNKGGGYTTRVVYPSYPKQKGFWGRLDDWLSRR